VARKLPTWFLAADLEGAAGIALVKCASRYDAAVGTTFKQFARQNVIGACIDAARRKEYIERGHASLNSYEYSFLRYSHGERGNKDTCIDTRLNPEALMIESEEQDRVASAMARLPARHRKVIQRVYFDGLSIGEAAPEFGVGASRLCQIHRKALAMLRELCAA
jgi:RNA polymerase sigma factor (sigma-70 family)